MKTILTLCAFTFLIVSSSIAQWTQCSGPYGGDIQSIFVSGNTVFASGNFTGLYRSTNNGDTWIAVNVGLRVISMVRKDSILFLATGKEAYRSYDNGDTWKVMSADIAGAEVSSFAVKNHMLFASTSKGVIRSEDNGESWMPASTETSANSFYTVAVMNEKILAGSYTNGIFRSTDNGETWTKTDNSIKSCYHIRMSDKILFAGTDNGSFRSSDDGIIWTRIPYISDLDGFAYDDSTYLAGTNVGLYRSQDLGVSWTQVNTGTKRTSFGEVVKTGNTIFAACGQQGVLRSTDNGVTWQEKNNGLSLHYVTGFAMNTNALIEYNNYTSPFRSTDNGDSWIQLNVSEYNYPIGNLVSNGTSFFGTVQGIGIFRSTDNGNSWVNINNKLTTGCLAVNGSTIYSGTYNNGIFKSTDNGESWIKNKSGLNDAIITNIVFGDSIIYAGSESGVYYSLDDGKNWLGAGLDKKRIGCMAIIGNKLIVRVLGGTELFTTTFKGDSWNRIFTDKPIDKMVVSGNTIYGCNAYSGAGVMYSKNMGITWLPINQGLDNLNVNALAVLGSTLLAGTTGSGVYKIDMNLLGTTEGNTKGISDIASLVCYPNPTTNTLTIDRSNLLNFNTTHPVTYIITTLTGEKLLEYEQNAMQFTVPVNGLGSGVYFLTAVQRAERAVGMVTVVE